MSSRTSSTGCARGSEVRHQPQRGLTVRGGAGQREALQPADVGGVGGRGDRLVLDDEYADIAHCCSSRWSGAWCRLRGLLRACRAGRHRGSVTRNSAPAGLVIAHGTAQPLHRLPDQGQAEAPPERARRLGAEAVPEDVVHGLRIDAGAAVLDRDLQGSASDSTVSSTSRGGGRLGRGVDGVVQQVAQDGDQVLHGQPGHRRGQPPAGVEGQLDAAFVRLGRLAHDQGAQHGLVDGADHVIGQLLAQLQVLGGEIQGFRAASQLHQGHHRVQPVGVLMGLGAQGVGKRPHGFQLAAQRLDLGPVADGGHGAVDGCRCRRASGGGAGPDGRALVHHQDPRAGQVDLVLGGPARTRKVP